MKPILATLILLLTATCAIAGDFTLLWEQTVPGLSEPLAIGSVGGKKITLAPLKPAKEKDPPRCALFVDGRQISRTPIYPGHAYAFAVSAKSGNSRWFINGCVETPAAVIPLDGDFTDGMDGVKHIDGALADEDIVALFKARVAGRNPITVGHRGDNKFSPENTNISYVNAIAKNCPIIELDLRLTRDNVLVLLHDATVDRTTDGQGKIVDMNFADAEKLDAGTWKDPRFKGEKIPTVETVANTARDKAILMFDLKCTGLGQSIAEFKRKTDFPGDQIILAPWEIAEGVELRKHLPDVPMVLLHGKLPAENFDDAFFARMKEIGFGGFSLNWQILTQAFVDAARKHDMTVYVWTVNDSPDVAGAVLANVTGIITDDVAATSKLVSNLSAKE